MSGLSKQWSKSLQWGGAILLILLLSTPRAAWAAPPPPAPDTPAPPAAISPDGSMMSGKKLRWEYPRFSTAEWVATALFGGLALGMQFVSPAQPYLKGGLLVDDDVRDALAVTDPEDQRTVRSVSDVLLTLLTAYPYLVDSLLVAAWGRQSPSAGWQMALINMQVMAVTVGITSVAKVAVSRTRPYDDTCGDERAETLHDCEGSRRHKSFFSGHASMAFASAGVTCMHHMYLGLYGSRGADIGACAAAYGAATATGVLRIVGDQHYLSDVVVGAAVGTITGLGLPWVLHYRHGKSGRPRSGRSNGVVDASIVPLANGLALSGIFDETGGLDRGDGQERPDTLGIRTLATTGNPWKSGRVRPFMATRLDLGFLFLKPRISAGYGRPHDVWAGVDINPLISFDGVGAWGGLRGTLGWIDLRAGARYQHTWSRSLLTPKGSYTRDDIEDRGGPNSSYVSLEAELTFDLPAGPGTLNMEAAGTYILGVQDGYHVYEETLKVVVAPPWVWRGRLGYILPLDRDRIFRIGLVTELVGIPGRDAHTFRGGLVGSARLMKNLEARITLLPTWWGSDSLGTAGSDFLLVGIRHRWATGTSVLQ